MPELPDVEEFRKYIDATALYQPMAEVALSSPEMLGEVDRRWLPRRLKTACFEATRRHGKYLFLQTDTPWSLVLHFGMTGYPAYFKSRTDSPEHTRLLITFESGYHLAYVCQRKLGLIDVTDDPDDFSRRKELGPDPLADGLDEAEFAHLLQGHRGYLKSALMNQQLLAGIGNVYSDEILFHAGFHPEMSAADMNDDQLAVLFKAMHRVLHTAIRCRTDPEQLPEDYLLRHREEGVPCPQCGGRIRKKKTAGRTAYFCDRHQSRAGAGRP